MKGIAVMGSTGSIGTQTLQIVSSYPDKFKVRSLSAGNNVNLLIEQIRKFQPSSVSLRQNSDADLVRNLFPSLEVRCGLEGLRSCINREDVEIVVMGIIGFSALWPTLESIRLGKTVALANKESLVVGGNLLRREISSSTAKLIPVDSEHSALFQLLENRDPKHVSKLILTASGGPFFKFPALDLATVTPDMAVKHPNWSMGKKISVDSATLMNKGLELIEAHFLFDVPEKNIEVWIHPQSIVHGALWLNDNSCLAQLSRPDMRLSIAYALHHPDRLQSVVPRLSLPEMGSLQFFEPDENRFPALKLARQALLSGPWAIIALNAANEVAVESFLEKEIPFTQISCVIEETLQSDFNCRVESIEEIYEVDNNCRQIAKEFIRDLPKSIGSHSGLSQLDNLL